MQPAGATSAIDHTMIALADPTRRAIIAMLEAGEARVTDIAAPFPISLNSVSKHIKLLERADLVRRRKVGREHYLSFNPEPLDEAARWIEEKRRFWSARLDALERILTEEDSRKKRRKK